MPLAAPPLMRDILDADRLTEMVRQGFVRVQHHPSLPLAIHNYTEACQYEGVWNSVTLACRGLIVNQATGGVVARPFPKFFNHDQPGAPTLNLTEPVTVTDKVDGSLGILYPVGDGRYAVATRGSFTSDQAIHATRVLLTRYPTFVPPAGHTVLFEIIYPENRIVLDYQGLDDLVLLGTVDLATGRTFGPEAVTSWPGPVVERFAFATLTDALGAPPRANREGLVVHVPSRDVRVKIKYEEYVRLHRLVTGLNARVIWEHLVALPAPGGAELASLVASLPDEFHQWVGDVAAALRIEVADAATAVEAAYMSIVDGLGEEFTRKDFALVAKDHPERGCLFLRLDGKDYHPLLWQRVRPEAGQHSPRATPFGRAVGPDAD